jgi:hypothetical protein
MLRNEANEVFGERDGRLVHARSEEALQDPESVPVVRFAKPIARDDHRVFLFEQAAYMCLGCIPLHMDAEGELPVSLLERTSAPGAFLVQWRYATEI